MSASSTKGRSLELDVAKAIRGKLGVQVTRDKRSGAGDWNKADLQDWYRELPLHVEIKNQATVKIKEWYRQAKGGASVGQAPTVVFAVDELLLATLSLNDLLDLVAEVKQLRSKVAELEQPTPVEPVTVTKGSGVVGTPKTRGGEAFRRCRGGNLVAPGATKCLVKGCKACMPGRKTKS
jgi:hypothetical protein